MSEERERYENIISNSVKTSTELLSAAKDLSVQLQKEDERDGISLYEVKNRDLLAYTRDLLYLMYQMSIGNSIRNDPAIERLVHLRTVLERMRPIEHRMKSYTEKLILLASGTTGDGAKALRPHPERLKVDDVEDLESEEEGSIEGGTSKETKTKKYIPPKLMAVHYNEDEEEVEERKIQRARRRALQSSLIQDLRAQYSEAPEEFQDDSIIKKKKHEDIERRKYEEDYLIRLQMTKKEKHNKKVQDRQNVLDELLHFGSYMAVKDAEKSVDGRSTGSASIKRRKVGRTKKFSKRHRGDAKAVKGKSKSGNK